MKWRIPDRLAAACRQSTKTSAWLTRLPWVVEDLERRWSLELGAPFGDPEASCAWVAPAVRHDGSHAVLKVGMPHFEGEHEIEGLRFWDGDPTVRLLDADDALGAMLLERCEPGFALRTLPEREQDAVIAGLLRRLWRPPPPASTFRSLSAMVALWRDQTLADADQWSDPGLVRQGLDLFTKLPRTAIASVVLATDLHAGNVLRAEREPWLVIDPKPFVGDPAYDATQHLLNCPDRIRADPQGTIGRFAELLGADRQRVQLWLFARITAEPRDDWRVNPRIEIARALAPTLPDLVNLG